MKTIYDQIAENKRKTLLISVFFILIISLLGYVLGAIYTYDGGISIMIVAMIFSSISALITYFVSDKAVLAISDARKVNAKESPLVYSILENLCIGAGLKEIPALYVINDSAPNAFATGRDPSHSAIAVTTGLLNKLDKREIEGVLAHELSHIRNYDIRLMTFVIILVGTISIIGNIMFRRSIFRDDKNSGGMFLIFGLIFAIITPILAKLIQLAMSRNREFLADASAALLTRDPEGLASALEKISMDQNELHSAEPTTAYLYIEDPIKKKKGMFGGSSIWQTHPPIQERIKRLRSM